MEPSRHNILSKIKDSDEYFIVNLLYGNADVLTAAEAEAFTGSDSQANPEFIHKGYLTDPAEEQSLFRQRYLDFLDARDTDEIQLFYAPTYACNFNCSYCYQEGYEQQKGFEANEVALAFFKYVSASFADRKKYVTLFGGEPLLPGEKNRAFVEFFVKHCKDHNLDLAVVTNGYALLEYVPVLQQARIREIQVTLDGPELVHDSRRTLKGGKGTFSRIVAGIDACLEKGLPVNLRMVADRENISALTGLAEFAIAKGWTKNPLFKTQLGRNYELHFCQSQQSKLYSRIDLYRDIYDLIKKNPAILEFHKPAYSVSKFLFENGELPDPLFDSCPGCKTEWAFDYTGKIYSCTATVGKAGEELGYFYPETEVFQDKISKWQERDVLSIQACSSCNLRLACGGGCASVAFHRNNDLNSPDCRPVRELLELGIGLYRQDC